MWKRVASVVLWICLSVNIIACGKTEEEKEVTMLKEDKAESSEGQALSQELDGEQSKAEDIETDAKTEDTEVVKPDSYTTEFAGQTFHNGSLGDIVSDTDEGLIVNISRLGYAYLNKEDVAAAAVGDILTANDGVTYECNEVTPFSESDVSIYLYCPEYDWYYYASTNQTAPGLTGIAIVDETSGTYMTERATEENTYKIKVADDAIAKIYLDNNVGVITEVRLVDLLRNPESVLEGNQLLYPLEYNSIMKFNDNGELYDFEMQWWG